MIKDSAAKEIQRVYRGHLKDKLEKRRWYWLCCVSAEIPLLSQDDDAPRRRVINQSFDSNFVPQENSKYIKQTRKK